MKKLKLLPGKISLRVVKILLKNIKLQNIAEKDRNDFAEITAALINKFRVEKADFSYYDCFDFWQKNGFHITPNHFYQPLPDTTKIPLSIFKKTSQMIGINLNDKEQLKLLENVFIKFQSEYNKIPHEPTGDDQTYYFHNLAFDGVDGLVYYSMIRNFKPKKVLEIGSGWSTKIAAQAALLNKNTQITCIEPYPMEFLKKGFPGLSKIISKDVQKIPLSFFEQLEKDDILFIDSTHTVKTGGDVNYLFLEVIPRLKKGVYIHIHDIFLPFDYPKKWVIDEKRFWAEQYLLQSFLTFNSSYKIIYSNNYMGYKYPQKVRKTFPKSPYIKGGSIWIKKIKD